MQTIKPRARPCGVGDYWHVFGLDIGATRPSFEHAYAAWREMVLRMQTLPKARTATDRVVRLYDHNLAACKEPACQAKIMDGFRSVL